MCDVISLPRSIVDTSKQLFKRVDEEKLLKGKSQDAIIAACIFIACRQGRVARTFKEIVALTSVPKKVSLRLSRVWLGSTLIRSSRRTLPNVSSSLSARSRPIPPAKLLLPPPPPPTRSLRVIATISACLFPCSAPASTSALARERRVFLPEGVLSPSLLHVSSSLRCYGAWLSQRRTLPWSLECKNRQFERPLSKPSFGLCRVLRTDPSLSILNRILTQDKEKLVNQQWFDASRPDGTRADWANLGL